MQPTVALGYSAAPLVTSYGFGIPYYPGNQTVGKTPTARALTASFAEPLSLSRAPLVYSQAFQMPTLTSYVALIQSGGYMAVGSQATELTHMLADRFYSSDAHIAKYVIALLDMFKLSDNYSAVFHALQQLLDKLTAKDIARLLYRANLIDSFLMSATQVGHANITVLLADDFIANDTLSIKAQIMAALKSGLRMYVTLNTGQDVYSAWVMTPESKAIRSYSNFPFNSFIMLGTQFLAASATGIYQMGADTDAGTPITARVRSGLLNFGTSKLKRIDRAYLGYMSTGTLCLRVVATAIDGTKTQYTYQMVPQASNVPVEGRVAVGRGVRSVYWSFELCNDSTSSAFELYDVEILPMVLSQRVI